MRVGDGGGGGGGGDVINSVRARGTDLGGKGLRNMGFRGTTVTYKIQATCVINSYRYKVLFDSYSLHHFITSLLYCIQSAAALIFNSCLLPFLRVVIISIYF